MKRYGFIALTVAFILSLSGLYYFHQKHDPVSDLTNVSDAHPAADVVSDASPSPIEAEQKRQIADAYGRLPISFEPNVGQTDEKVKFLARGQGYALFLTPGEAVLALKKEKANEHAVLRMRLDGANPTPAVSGLNETASKTNYFIGNDSEKWRTGVANYSRVKYEAVYDGIDLVYYGSGQRLEYDFLVAPNADPNQIRLKFDGVKSARIDQKSGDLLLETGGETIRQHAPVVYQNIDG